MTRRIRLESHLTDNPPARITITHAQKDSQSWQQYLQGADKRYADFSLEGVTEDHAEAGLQSDTWCTLAWINGELAGGMRMHVAARLPILDELNGYINPRGLALLIQARQADGVVHCGGLWVSQQFSGYLHLASDLARSHLVLVRLAGARWSIGTSAEHTLEAWSSLGYRAEPSIPPFPYPDDRYQTRVVWADMWRLHDVAESLDAWADCEASRIDALGPGHNATITPFRRT